MRGRVGEVAVHHDLVQPGLGGLQVLGGPVPFVELVDEGLPGLAVPVENGLLGAPVEQVELFVECFEDLLEVPGRTLQRREVDRYARDAPDGGDSFELTLWRADGAVPDDAVLLRVAGQVPPTVPGWAAAG